MGNIMPVRERAGVAPVRSIFDDFFTRWLEEPASRLPEVFRGNGNIVPAVDVSETDKAVLVAFELPGLNEKDIDVQIVSGRLIVSGERKWEDEKKGREFHRVESQYGAFNRTVTLPENVKTDAVEATYKKGVLTVTLPKTTPTPSAKVKIKTE